MTRITMIRPGYYQIEDAIGKSYRRAASHEVLQAALDAESAAALAAASRYGSGEALAAAMRAEGTLD